MKKVKIKNLKKDATQFKFNTRSKVIWEIQTKFKEQGKWYVTITATVSKRTKNVSTDTDVWVEWVK